MTITKLGLLPPAERKARTIAKQQSLLKWLRDETWSTPQILGQVMGLTSRQSAYRALAQMEKAGFLASSDLPIVGKATQRVYGITAHGLAHAYQPEDPFVSRPTFEPSKLKLTTFQHEIDIQTLRFKAEQSGWKNWMPGARLGASQFGEKRPDAIATDPQNRVFALEIERTIKTRKRYEVLLSQYLQIIAKGKLHRVIWLCPTSDLSQRLRRIILSITAVPVQGQRISLESRHYELIEFSAYTDWPVKVKTEERTQ